MATTTYVGGPVPDELLRVTGTTNTPFETLGTAATTTTGGVYIGENMPFQARLIVAGVVTGTSPTLDVTLQDSADGVTYTTMSISFPQVVTTMGAATGSLSAFPRLAAITKPGRPYVRASRVVGGTTPSFASVAVVIGPTGGSGL